MPECTFNVRILNETDALERLESRFLKRWRDGIGIAGKEQPRPSN